MRQVVLDTETTGLEHSKGHRIIEIGCIELINRQITPRHYHIYINPERPIDPGAQQVHGITAEFLKDKPIFKNIFQIFLEFIDGAELIIHNAAFDVGFINHEFNLINYTERNVNDHCQITDTLALAKRLHPGQRNSLDALCKRYHVDNTHRERHGALLDATLLAHVYLAMTGGQASLFEEENARSITTKRNETKAAPIKQVTLPVIYANEEESLAHQQTLERIKKENGKCVW
ncbi:MAG: DNA polymerase III subunit epsilon [Gammaproteobacteria bacterium]|nr:DNA polymerase III subunit epsilon [Gammaproteobacteria bacterium]